MASARKATRMGEDAGIEKYQSLLKQGGPTQSDLSGAIARQQKAKMGLIGGTLKAAGARKPPKATGVQGPVDMQQQKTVQTAFEKVYSPEDIAAAEGAERARYQGELRTSAATTKEADARRAAQRQGVLQTIGKIGGGAVKAAGAAAMPASLLAKPGGKLLAGALGSSPQQIQQQEFMAALTEKARGGDEEAKQQLLEFYKQKSAGA